MPRHARLDAPGVVHHVIIRGIERRKIFLDDEDQDDLLDRIGLLFPKTHTLCYAWALLPNHAHFLLRTGEVPLATVMRRLLTGYAVRFNRRHRRHGQLFQNRYKSIICQEDVYLRELVRYIHLNPLRVKLVSDVGDLSEYGYCGHGALLGKRRREWQETEFVLSYFGGSLREARSMYVNYMEEGAEQGRRPELVGGGLIRSLGGWEEVKRVRLTGQDRVKGDERILGSDDFVDEVLSLAEEKYARHYELKRLGYTLKKVQGRVAELYGIDEKEIATPGRQKKRAEARSVLFYWAVRELGLNGTFLARRFGMSQPGVVYAVKRGERIAEEKGYRLL
jgi:REP element-mobilizing transposase RayT